MADRQTNYVMTTQAAPQPYIISDQITNQLHNCNVDEDEQVCSKQWDVCRRMAVQEQCTLDPSCTAE